MPETQILAKSLVTKTVELSPAARNIDRLEITVRNGNLRTSHTCILARSDETGHPIGQIREKWPDHLRPDTSASHRAGRFSVWQMLTLH